MNVYMSQTDWYVMSFFAWFGATVLGAFGRTSVHNV